MVVFDKYEIAPGVAGTLSVEVEGSHGNSIALLKSQTSPSPLTYESVPRFV